MLRLAADENFDSRIVRGLLRVLPELDLVRVQDTELAAAPDPDVLAWAAQIHRGLKSRLRHLTPQVGGETITVAPSARFALEIQQCVDVAAHWVGERGWGPAEKVGEAIEILRGKGVLNEELTTGLRGATGLRNRIAHGYTDIAPERMYDEYQDGTEVLRRFLAIVAEAAGL